MDFRERFLTALAHEEPDRVPVMGLILDAATANQILGKEPSNIVSLLRDPQQRAGMRAAMTGDEVWNQSYIANVSDVLEAAAKLGFDANWAIYAWMELADDPDADLGIAWHDTFGRVWEIGDDGRGNMTLNYTRGLCDTEEKWEAWMEARAADIERTIDNVREFHRELDERFRERILPVGYAASGIFENCWQPLGFVGFSRLLYRNPDFVRRMVAFFTDYHLRYIDAAMDYCPDVVLTGDDLGLKTGPMVRPETIEEFFGESYRRVSDLVHSRGRKLIFHSCGNIYAFLESFIEWGFDALITLEPTAGMDLARVREQVGHRLALIGNLDVSRLLVSGSREEVHDAVKSAIRAAGRGGGYVLSASHSHARVDATRLEWMLEAAHRYGRYPIRL